MAISLVNGYLCFCSCDAAKAKKGEDPQKSSDPNVQYLKDKEKAALSGIKSPDQSATVFGGALADRTTTNGVTAVDGAQAPAAITRQSDRPAVDLLV